MSGGGGGSGCFVPHIVMDDLPGNAWKAFNWLYFTVLQKWDHANLSTSQLKKFSWLKTW